MRNLFLLLCIYHGVTSSLHAQDSLQTSVLDEVVITANRSGQQILDIPRSLSVIDKHTIESTPFNSVGELLNSQTGLYVVGANQTPGSNQSLFMRGSSGHQVTVLIDGIRINDPSTPNASIDLSELSLTHVERIEVLKGSHSTLYGGSAIGGVVNIITRKSDREGLHGAGSVQFGSYSGNAFTLKENLGLTKTYGNGLYVNLSAHQENVKGLDASIKHGDGPISYTSDQDDFRKTDFLSKMGYQNKRWDASVSYKKIHQVADIDAGAYVDDDNNYIEFDRGILTFDAAYRLNDNWKISATGFGSELKRLNENDSSVVADDGSTDQTYLMSTYRGEHQTYELQLNCTRQQSFGVVGGGIYFEKMSFNSYFYSDAFGPFESTIDYDSLNPKSRTTYAFGQANFKISAFNFSIGSRISHHSLFGLNSTFELNPSIKFKRSLIYASLSTGYNAPSLYQLFDPTMGFGAIRTRGNKNLNPEKSLSLELGWKTEFTSTSYFTVAAFHTRTKDLIEYVYLWNGAKQIEDLDFTDYRGDSYINVASQRVVGLEFDFHHEFSDRLNVGTNLAILEGKINASANDISENFTNSNYVQLYNYGDFLVQELTESRLIRRPAVIGSAQLGYNPTRALNLVIAYRHTGSRFDAKYDPSLGPYGALSTSSVRQYDLIDFQTSYQLNKVIVISLRVENVFDENYSEIAGFSTRGRSGYIKLLARF